MKKNILKFPTFFLIIILLTGCGPSYTSLVKTAVTGTASLAYNTVKYTGKSVIYTLKPSGLYSDVNKVNNILFVPLISLIKNASQTWGEKNTKIPTKKEYVKYMQNYKSRALVDFDKGIITVETLDNTDYQTSLKNAIITTLLLPDDPRSADLFSAKKITFNSTPYLFGEVKDNKNKNINSTKEASKYANYLLNKKYKTKSITKNNKRVKVHYVTIKMVKDHTNIRVQKVKPFVKRYAKKYNISENLIYAIIKTESNFNQFAVSHTGALGLMQIVPTSAGVDSNKFVNNSSSTPSKTYLFNAQNNIEFGVAYLHILNNRYLTGINNPISKEYCVISAYNTGSGNVLKTFSSNQRKAKKEINSKSSSAIYKKLRNDLPYEETRNYLKKVINNKKQFVDI